MLLDNNTWTNHLYRFAEFLYWEPHHINRQKRPSGDMQAFATAMSRLRTLEVPLNVLFNMTIHLSPQRIKRRILSCFVPLEGTHFGQKIESIDIYDHLKGSDIVFIQPDAVLESDQARICLELKIEATLSLSQMYKYLALLGFWQTEKGVPKIPYLLFLTKKKLRAQWTSRERSNVFTEPEDLDGLSNYLRKIAPPEKFSWNSSPVPVSDMIDQVKDEVQVGWATWQMVGDSLQAELKSLDLESSSERDEMLARLLGDFLAELNQRRLWHSKT